MTIEEDIEIFGEFENGMKLNSEEISKKFNLFNTFINIAKIKMNPVINDSAFFGLIGPRRTSKSTLSIVMGHAINPDFSIDDICFSFEELKSILTDDAIRRRPIVWEEASVTAYSRDFQDEINKELNKYFQVFGFRNLSLIANFQHLSLLDNHTRMQLDVLLKCKSYYGKDENGNLFTRKAVQPFKVVNDGIKDPLIVDYKIPGDMSYKKIGEIPIPTEDALFKMFGVKRSLMDKYQKRKIEFFKNLDGENQKISKKEIDILKRKEEALTNIAKHLQTKGMSQKGISDMMELPQQTASRWKLFNPKQNEFDNLRIQEMTKI